jgi:hypothetical protein
VLLLWIGQDLAYSCAAECHVWIDFCRSIGKTAELDLMKGRPLRTPFGF